MKIIFDKIIKSNKILDRIKSNKICITIIIIIFIIVYLILYSHYNSLYDKEIGTSRYYGQIEHQSIKLSNNIWGATSEERTDGTLKSYIYYKFDGDFGWEWNRPDPRPDYNTYIPPIYPEVIIGEQLWDTQTNLPSSPYFPIQLKDINSWIAYVEYKYVEPTTGSYNLAYDIWFGDELPPATKKAEVMIWIQGRYGNLTPNRYVSDGIMQYEYYFRHPDTERPWDYHVFILKNQNSKDLYRYRIDIKRLLDTLSINLDDDWYIPGIEFGNEIWRGTGRIEINRFDINLNGNAI